MVHTRNDELKEQAHLIMNQIGSHLFDLAQADQDPGKELEDNIVFFIKCMILEALKLSNNKEEFLDRINPLK
jgi:hypothetical protein